MEPRLTEDELDAMLARATDGGDHEWGWYVDDVPRLIRELREMREDHDLEWGPTHTYQPGRIIEAT